jgi:hypothetical protein
LFKLPPMNAILLNPACRGFGEGHLAEIGNKIDAMHYLLRVNPVGATLFLGERLVLGEEFVGY